MSNAEGREFCACESIHADVVEYVKPKMPREEEINKLSVFFKVFGDSTRLKVLSALDIREMCVCDIAALLKTTKSAVSHQLATLKQSNLVSFRREGKVIFYSLADDHIRKILEYGVEHINEP